MRVAISSKSLFVGDTLAYLVSCWAMTDGWKKTVDNEGREHRRGWSHLRRVRCYQSWMFWLYAPTPGQCDQTRDHSSGYARPRHDGSLAPMLIYGRCVFLSSLLSWVTRQGRMRTMLLFERLATECDCAFDVKFVSSANFCV